MGQVRPTRHSYYLRSKRYSTTSRLAAPTNGTKVRPALSGPPPLVKIRTDHDESTRRGPGEKQGQAKQKFATLRVAFPVTRQKTPAAARTATATLADGALPRHDARGFPCGPAENETTCVRAPGRVTVTTDDGASKPRDGAPSTGAVDVAIGAGVGGGGRVVVP